jgi:hypothetical protein
VKRALMICTLHLLHLLDLAIARHPRRLTSVVYHRLHNKLQHPHKD